MPQEPSVLLVDDNPATAGIGRPDSASAHLQVYEADTGAAAIAAIRARAFDLAIIDFRLPDISGLDIIVALKKDRVSVPWVLVSGWMTPALAVEAMRLGALDAVELPVDIEGVVLSALHGFGRPEAATWPRLCTTAALATPKSAAERWAFLVLRGCRAEHESQDDSRVGVRGGPQLQRADRQLPSRRHQAAQRQGLPAHAARTLGSPAAARHTSKMACRSAISAR